MTADERSMEHDNGTLVLLKDFYNVREVAALLHWSRGRVYAMAERKVDPLPLRRFEGRKRNYLIQRDELIDWYDRNYLYLQEGGQDEQTSVPCSSSSASSAWA